MPANALAQVVCRRRGTAKLVVLGPHVLARSLVPFVLTTVAAADHRATPRGLVRPYGTCSAAFASAECAERWPHGNTHRNRLRPGRWHQQSSAQPHVIAPRRSATRLPAATRTYPVTTARTIRFT